jgi:hypothetical protein
VNPVTRIDSEVQPGRAFLVGCPRSGTTLLQSLLFGHPDVMSCPETFFFVNAMNTDGKLHRLGLASRGMRRGVDALAELGLLEPRGRQPRPIPRTERGCADLFTRALDAATSRAGKALWIEKTPSHVHRVDAIERYVPRAAFVHMIRQGAAAVASLHDVTQRHPAAWGGPRDVEACMLRWKEDVRLSMTHSGKPNHAFVAYEDLVGDTRAVVGRLCRFLGLRDDPSTRESMLTAYADRSVAVSNDEPWKDAVAGPIVNRNDARLERLFSARERQRIAHTLADEQRAVEQLPFI